MASLILTEQAALKVFEIPELAYLICAINQKRDNANLMQVCRKLFYSILPLVWEEINRPDLLVSLIPGGGIVSYKTEPLPYVVMELPCSLNLSRFNIYAPYVKRLTLSPIDVDGYGDWERFHSCTRSVDLLPNLETIYFPASYVSESITKSGKSGIDSVNWAITFLSKSLKALVQAPPTITHSTQYNHPLWLDFDSFSSLVTSVVQRCPRLHSLSILPARVRSTGLPNRRGSGPSPRILFSYEYPEIYSSLVQLGNLTSLLISAVLLCPEGLIALSALPKLESLYIAGWERDPEAYYDHLRSPINMFPRLKHLELTRLSWNTVSNVCNTKALISNLRSLTITSPHNYSIPYPSDERGKNISDIIPLLATHNSNITTLAVHDYGNHQLSPEVLDAWGRLPLVTLHLGWSVIYYCGFDVFFSILSRLPLLEDLQLEMTQAPFELKQMKQIIELLPRLSRIRIPVNWESITELTWADFIPCRTQSDSPLYVKSNFYLSQSQEEGAGQIARYLSTLRPTGLVVCESSQASFDSYSASPEYTSNQLSDMINTELSGLGLK
ncbi:putative LRR receptor-like serine/threonine-protein kinase At4g36180 [Rhizoctonia solani]|uniref:Putative LRR receptor-like serine/threonine-protein kinase At4g36180 n=1 Tax=Rhizoctonia solani TaxID=456999 RepID=A0A0K6FYC3_9AGAM|nr:putative LRR receptor-like serine/threonine-protein kinase At4g36180 [Rhizoctonia solani]